MQEISELLLRKLKLSNGKIPFDDWFESLKDERLQHSVSRYIVRLRARNFGNSEGVGKGVFELKINVGPGLRVYYGLVKSRIIILIGGGDKSTQSSDIRKAQKLLKEYLYGIG